MHHRLVLSLAGARSPLLEALLSAVGTALERIDLRRHQGVHPRVGVADVLPIVPLGSTSLAECEDLARELGARIWRELRVPVFFYGRGRSLAAIRAGRLQPDLGGPDPHPTAGYACVGARAPLVAFNVVLPELSLAAGRKLAKSLRESNGGLRGVQALAFQLSPGRVQLSMNLFRLEETTPGSVLAELERRGVVAGDAQLVGLCPALAAGPESHRRLLEGRLAAAAARAGARLCFRRGDDEHRRLGRRLAREADELAELESEPEELLAGAEEAAALIRVLRAARLWAVEAEAMLEVAAQGLRAAVKPETAAASPARLAALDRWLAEG